MFKSVGDNVWAFDLEWVPDPRAGRRVYNLPPDMPDADVLREMWSRGGATEEEPRPYLKIVLCRVVSAAVVIRKKIPGGKVALDLRSLPRNPDEPMTESQLLTDFLQALGKAKPQLVGFNSTDADVPILVQRGIAAGITAPAFCKRPDKPWEGPDYFYRYGEAHLDLKDIVGGWGKGTPSLHELAQAAGIPGKMGTDGSTVIDLWLAGKVREIVEYNQFDALTTYLVWLRTAHFAGLFSTDEYHEEEERLKQLLRDRISRGEGHFQPYLERWESLNRAGNLN